MRRGEIYLVDLGREVDHCQARLRPVVIVQNNVGNHYSGTTIVAPLTTKPKKPMPTHTFTYATGTRSTILAEQIKTVDKRWLGRKVGELTRGELELLDMALAISIGLI